MRHGHQKADEAKRECDGTHLARSASATVHTFHVKWAKVAMCGERTQVIFVLYRHRVARSDDSYLVVASRADAEPSSTSGSIRSGLCGLMS